jgi:hypothetical protein
MNVLYSIAKRRVAGVVGACALVLGGFATAAVAGAGSADAATCTVATPCSVAGTAGLTGGTLTVTAPDTLNWVGVLSGTGQDLVDANGPGSTLGGANGDEGYVVDDATGSGTGWHVTVSATTFTSTTPTAATLPDTGTFSTNGTITGTPADLTAPTATCTTGPTDCTLPTNTVTYPVPITTAATAPVAATVYAAALGSGLGSVTIGTFGAITGADPVGWWVHVPSSAVIGSYGSTVTIAIIGSP